MSSVFLLLSLIFAPPTAAGASVELKGQKFQVELALTPSDQERGLMYREKLGARQGMLFVFPDERPRSFWMKNTLIPLDIIFISKAQKVVSIIKNAEPLNLKPLPSEGAAKYVLEIRGGEASAIHLKPGDSVKFFGLPK